MASAGVFDGKTQRYKKLAIPKIRLDHVSDPNAFKVKRGALSYQITDSMRKLAEPRRYPKAEGSKTTMRKLHTRNLDAIPEKRKSSYKGGESNTKRRKGEMNIRSIPVTKRVSFVRD